MPFSAEKSSANSLTLVDENGGRIRVGDDSFNIISLISGFETLNPSFNLKISLEDSSDQKTVVLKTDSSVNRV